MIEIPLVYETENTNVFAPQCLNNYSPHFDRQMPWLLQTFQSALKIISPAQIEDVDWFIYPVIMHEPWFQIRALQGFHHHDYGFWSHISDKVIKALKEKRGWILIDATVEPLSDSDLSHLLTALEDCSEFPNDRILLNTHSSTYARHPQILNHPSWLEMHFCIKGLRHLPPEAWLEGGKIQRKELHIPPFNEIEWDHVDLSLSEKRFCCFQMRWFKHKGSAMLLAMLDRIDAFKKGYVTADNLENFFEDYSAVNGTDVSLLPSRNKSGTLTHIDDIMEPVDFVAPYCMSSGFNAVLEAYYNDFDLDFIFITEKIFRNISHGKPFVVIGQRRTLARLHEMGYKTFHPHINESYDSLSDHDRVFAAFLEMKKLIDMTDDEFSIFEEKLTSIHEHNHKNFQRRITAILETFETLRDDCVS